MSDLMNKALMFATKKHDGQTRQDAVSTPYITHPIEVSIILREAGASEKSQVIALLHDTIEDTNTTYEELIEEFGDDIADGVMEVTDDKMVVFNRLSKDIGVEAATIIVNNANLLKREFKVQQAYDMPKKSLEAREVKIADKISNVRSLIVSPPSWSKKSKFGYLEACKTIVDAGLGTNKYLEDLFNSYYVKAKQIIGGNNG
jgi:guanosine-3',5'-bis(diphosphate) 3'-pyrophosphohydrolase